MSIEHPLPPPTQGDMTAHELTDLRRREREAERWAQALGASLASAVEPPRPKLGQSAATPTGWQGSDGSMTQSKDVTKIVSGRDSENENPLDRIRLDVRTGELGEVALVVDRSKAGVRVFIGLEQDKAKSLVEPERALLEQALRASGLSVRSVEVVRSNTLGTVLAERRERQRFSDASETPQRHDETRKRRDARRLNLIG